MMENRDAAAAAKDIVAHPIHRGSKELLTAWSSMSALSQKGTLTPHIIKAIRRPASHGHAGSLPATVLDGETGLGGRADSGARRGLHDLLSYHSDEHVGGDVLCWNITNAVTA